MKEEDFYDFVDFDEFDSQNLQEGEGSNISSRKSSISQGNRPSKRIKTRVVLFETTLLLLIIVIFVKFLYQSLIKILIENVITK